MNNSLSLTFQTGSTNFVIPNSRHVFILVGFTGEPPKDFRGEVTLSSERGTNLFVVSKSMVEANWLASQGLNSFLLTSNSLVDKIYDDRYRPGTKCQLAGEVTNAPKEAAIYVGFLR